MTRSPMRWSCRGRCIGRDKSAARKPYSKWTGEGRAKFPRTSARVAAPTAAVAWSDAVSVGGRRAAAAAGAPEVKAAASQPDHQRGKRILIVIFPAAIQGKKESPRRPQATERHATAKCGAAAEVPDLRRASRHAKGRLAIRRGMQRGDSRRLNKRSVACQATIHRRSTCPHR
jgi:hypothetical protein